MRKINVLVTGAGALLGQGIIKALRMSATVGLITAVDSSPKAVGLYLADKAYLVPQYQDFFYLWNLARIAKENKVEAILCGTDLEVMTLSRKREALEMDTGAKVIVSHPDTVTIANDKYLTAKWLEWHGLNAPLSVLPGDADLLVEGLGFPLIVKPRFGAGSVGLSVVHNQEELTIALRVPGMVIQEYLQPDDEEYTCGTVVFNGKCIGSTALKRTLRHGNTHVAISDDYDEVAEYAAQVTEKLPGAYGPVNMQLRHTEQGPTIFEINARFSGTTPIRAELGYNEVDVVLTNALDGWYAPPDKLTQGIMLHYMSEVLVPFNLHDTLQKGGWIEATG